MTTKGQVRHAFPAYRIFIFGQEVSNDVLDVNPNWNLGRSPNTCTITLANLNDKYIFTTSDFKIVYNDVDNLDDIINKRLDNKYAGLTHEEINDVLILENTAKIENEFKRNIINKKITVKEEDVIATDIDGKFRSLKPLTGNAYRYPLQAENPIFHVNDEVRVFMRDPFNFNRWYHMFAGLVSDFDDNIDENNQAILTIMCEGPTKKLRYKRITFNPGIIDQRAVVDKERDVAIRTFWANGLANLTLPELIFFIIFGNNPDDDTKFSLRRDSSIGASVVESRVDGAGDYSYSKSMVFEYGPPSTSGNTDAFQKSLQNIPITKIDSLSIWQSVIDHEVKITDIDDMLTEKLHTTNLVDELISQVVTFADGTPDTQSIITIIGTNPQYFPTDGGRILILIPASFHVSTNREVLLRDILQSPAMVTEFTSRLRIIYDTIERIEFVFYESPKGDLIIEFPLYDFDPDDWGNNKTSTKYIIENQKLIPVDVECGPFTERYIITKENTVNFSRQITDEKVRTQVVGHWQYVQGYTAIGTSKDVQAGAVTTLSHLIPLYGYRLEQTDPKGFIATKEAAYLYGQITLNKLNADAINLGINAIPNFGLWLNRPIYFARRNCIGITTSLSHSIKWGMGGSVDTRININYIRGWDGSIDKNNQMVYTTIGGYPSRPLNYAVLFKQNKEIVNQDDKPKNTWATSNIKTTIPQR